MQTLPSCLLRLACFFFFSSLFAGVLVWFCGGLSIIPSVSSVLGEKVVSSSVSAWEQNREEHGPFSIGKNLFCLFLLFLYNCSRHSESFIGMCTSEASVGWVETWVGIQSDLNKRSECYEYFPRISLQKFFLRLWKFFFILYYWFWFFLYMENSFQFFSTIFTS